LELLKLLLIYYEEAERIRCEMFEQTKYTTSIYTKHICLRTPFGFEI